MHRTDFSLSNLLSQIQTGVFSLNSFTPRVQRGAWPHHVHHDLLKRPPRRFPPTPNPPSSDVSKAILFVPLTPGRADGDPLPLLADHGVSQHSFTQVAAWGKKGPSDHLPLVSATMGPPSCQSVLRVAWPLCPSDQGAEQLRLHAPCN